MGLFNHSTRLGIYHYRYRRSIGRYSLSDNGQELRLTFGDNWWGCSGLPGCKLFVRTDEDLNVAISFTAKTANQGFDKTSSPPWQMVPVGGSRKLTFAGSGKLTPYVRDPKKLSIAVSESTITLKGLAEGRTFVDWLSTPTATVEKGFTLEVSVKKKRQIRTAFHYVDDGRKQQTARRPKNVINLIAMANAILTTQANIEIVKKSAKILPIKTNLGAVVRFSSHLKGVPKKQHEWDDLKAKVDKTADFNVFFVVAYEHDKTPFKDNANAGTIASHKMCVLEDHPLVSASARTLAHETVHLLTALSHTRHGLMGPAGAGRLLTKAQINTINPSGVK